MVFLSYRRRMLPYPIRKTSLIIGSRVEIGTKLDLEIGSWMAFALGIIWGWKLFPFNFLGLSLPIFGFLLKITQIRVLQPGDIVSLGLEKVKYPKMANISGEAALIGSLFSQEKPQFLQELAETPPPLSLFSSSSSN